MKMSELFPLKVYPFTCSILLHLAGNTGAAGQGGGRKRKNSAGGRQSGFEAKRPLLG